MGCFVGCALDAATIIVDQSPKESDVPPRQGGFGGSGVVQSNCITPLCSCWQPTGSIWLSRHQAASQVRSKSSAFSLMGPKSSALSQ